MITLFNIQGDKSLRVVFRQDLESSGIREYSFGQMGKNPEHATKPYPKGIAEVWRLLKAHREFVKKIPPLVPEAKERAKKRLPNLIAEDAANRRKRGILGRLRGKL